VQNLTPYYQAWDTLLFNSDFDTLPCAPLEAASHGCPSVASCRYGGLSEFIVHRKTGFLLAEHEPEKLADFAVQLAENPELALTLRRNAVARLTHEFNQEKALNFYENFFQRRPGQ
jgi:glycosyltransferase involved in cell wall biosynthesis